MKNQKSVFEFGDEFVCTEFYNVETNCRGVEITCNDERLGSAIGLSIPGIEDEEENIKFDNEIINWIVDNNR